MAPTITNRPCRTCGHTWMAHRRTSTGACEQCDCKAFIEIPAPRVQGKWLWGPE